jgi:hypothetical protein
MRILALVLALAAASGVAGCGGPKSQVLPEDAVDFRTYRRIGVRAFADKSGRGKEIAAAFDARLQQAMYDPVDQKALAVILTQYTPDRDLGYGIEALEVIHTKTGADALITGRMAPDWSSAMVMMSELSAGSPILRALLRPRGRHKKVFTTPDEVAEEFMRVYRDLR